MLRNKHRVGVTVALWASAVAAESVGEVFLGNLLAGEVHKEEVELVVHQNAKDISASDPFHSVRTVYCSGKAFCNKLALPLPVTKGENDHSVAFLHHISENYHKLAKWTVFSQGSSDPMQMPGSPPLEDYLRAGAGSNDDMFVFTGRMLLNSMRHARRSPDFSGHRPLCPNETGADRWLDPELVDPTLTAATTMCRMGVQHLREGAKEFWRKHVQMPEPVGGRVHFVHQGRFAVSRSRIHQRPQSFYRELLQEVRPGRMCEPFHLQRMMYYVLGKPEHSPCPTRQLFERRRLAALDDNTSAGFGNDTYGTGVNGTNPTDNGSSSIAQGGVSYRHPGVDSPQSCAYIEGMWFSLNDDHGVELIEQDPGSCFISHSSAGWMMGREKSNGFVNGSIATFPGEEEGEDKDTRLEVHKDGSGVRFLILLQRKDEEHESKPEMQFSEFCPRGQTLNLVKGGSDTDEFWDKPHQEMHKITFDWNCTGATWQDGDTLRKKAYSLPDRTYVYDQRLDDKVLYEDGRMFVELEFTELVQSAVRQKVIFSGHGDIVFSLSMGASDRFSLPVMSPCENSRPHNYKGGKLLEGHCEDLDGSLHMSKHTCEQPAANASAMGCSWDEECAKHDYECCRCHSEPECTANSGRWNQPTCRSEMFDVMVGFGGDKFFREWAISALKPTCGDFKGHIDWMASMCCEDLRSWCPDSDDHIYTTQGVHDTHHQAEATSELQPASCKKTIHLDAAKVKALEDKGFRLQRCDQAAGHSGNGWGENDNMPEKTNPGSSATAAPPVIGGSNTTWARPTSTSWAAGAAAPVIGGSNTTWPRPTSTSWAAGSSPGTNEGHANATTTMMAGAATEPTIVGEGGSNVTTSAGEMTTSISSTVPAGSFDENSGDGDGGNAAGEFASDSETAAGEFATGSGTEFASGTPTTSAQSATGEFATGTGTAAGDFASEAPPEN